MTDTPATLAAPALPDDARAPVPPRLTQLAAAIGAIITAAGVLVLAGWAVGSTVLVGRGPGGTMVLPNTAVGFVLMGIALWMLRERGDGAIPSAARVVAGLLGAVVAIGGGTILWASIAGRPLWMDDVLFPASVRRLPWRPPGRVAINTAVALTLLGLAIAGQAVGRRALVLARSCATLSLVVAFLGVVGYAYGVQRLYRYGELPGGMALATALLVAIASLGALAVRPTRGFAALVLGDDAGGVLARRLLPAAMLVPFALGWVFLAARHADVVDRAAGTALLVIGTTTAFLLLISAVARTVRGMSAEREAILVRERAARLQAEAASRAAAEASRQAEQARAEAETANRAKSEFLATMSHELRTPLNAIAGYSELLAMGLRGPVTPAQAEDLERIRRAQRHLLGLINDVLNFAKVEAGRVDLHLTRIGVSEVLRAVEALIGSLAQQKGLTLAFAGTVRANGPAPVLTARADRERLVQILLNLLSNAVKFTPAGGTITIAAEPCAPDHVAVHVSDTGPGIPPDQLERIFEPFVQLRQFPRAAAEGTGLGLAISRELARAMGGDLLVRSIEGEGSTFTVVLPRDA